MPQHGARRRVRFACCQFEPAFKDVARSQNRADQLLASLRIGDVDIVVLPEMAFTGYSFSSRDEIAPFVERANDGPTFAWASRQAARLGAYVLVGCPIIEEGDRFFNAVLLVDGAGNLLHVYRKHFLFMTDESWASEGPGFLTLELPDLGKVGIGICMDINPRQFEAPFRAFEFANFQRKNGARILLLSMAWLTSDEGYSQASVIAYWKRRLEPLIGTDGVAVICNRTGTEGITEFCGTSCIVRLTGEVIAATGRSEQTVIVGHVDL